MTRLCGLPSDELFAIPAIHAVPVFTVRARRLPGSEVSTAQTDSNPRTTSLIKV
jgi:hypothetical protein